MQRMLRAKEASEEVFGGFRSREFAGRARKGIAAFFVLYMVYEILWVGGIFANLGIFIPGHIHRPVTVGIALAITFLITPGRKADQNRLPWYDAICILLSLLTAGYVALEYFMVTPTGDKMAVVPPASPFEQVLGTVNILLIIEGLRRSVGWVLAAIGVVFVAYPMFASYLPGLLYGPPYTYRRLMDVLYVYPQVGIYGSMAHLFSTVLMAFLIFGAFLVASGAGKFFINLALALLGHVRGGPAKVAVIGSALFGMVNGGTAANVIATGTITIPLMKSIGYRAEFAGAVEAVASTGGALMPPVMGVVAFLMMDFLGVSYVTIITAALVPACLYYLALFIQVDAEAARTGLKGVPQAELPLLGPTLLGGWLFFVPFAMLIYLLAVLRFSAETSVIYSIGVLIAVSLFKKETRLTLSRSAGALVGATRGTPTMVCTLSLAGLLTGVMAMTGLGVRLSSGLVDLAAGNLQALLVLTAVACIVLGMGLPSSGVYIIVAITMAPALVKVGINPIIAHLFVFFMGNSAHFTPPVCGTAYVAAMIANAGMLRTGFIACRLGIAAYIVPFMFVYSPELLMRGSPLNIAVAIIVATVGIGLLAYGIGGYLFRRTRWLERVMIMLAGSLMLLPGTELRIAGAVLGAVMVLWQRQAAPGLLKRRATG